MLNSLRIWWKQRSFHKLKRERLEDIFTATYKRNEWGGTPGTFYSGDGTHHPDSLIYINKVREFISQKGIRSIFEIGCGDFHISGQIIKGLQVNYLGGDVVEDLIRYNQKHFQTETIKFQKLNAVADSLPKADLIIIRQVLQHLSNEHVSTILSKISHFKHALITEHLPVKPGFQPNLDKISGPHVRLNYQSGVFITQPPFNVQHAEEFLEYPNDVLVKKKNVPAVLRTYLINQ
jgi:hypothetical protein